MEKGNLPGRLDFSPARSAASRFVSCPCSCCSMHRRNVPSGEPVILFTVHVEVFIETLRGLVMIAQRRHRTSPADRSAGGIHLQISLCSRRAFRRRRGCRLPVVQTRKETPVAYASSNFARSCCFSVPVPVSPINTKRTESLARGSVSRGMAGAAPFAFPFPLAPLFWADTLAATLSNRARTKVTYLLQMRFINSSPIFLWQRIQRVVHDQTVIAIHQQ